MHARQGCPSRLPRLLGLSHTDLRQVYLKFNAWNLSIIGLSCPASLSPCRLGDLARSVTTPTLALGSRIYQTSAAIPSVQPSLLDIYLVRACSDRQTCCMSQSMSATRIPFSPRPRRWGHWGTFGATVVDPGRMCNLIEALMVSEQGPFGQCFGDCQPRTPPPRPMAAPNVSCGTLWVTHIIMFM